MPARAHTSLLALALCVLTALGGCAASREARLADQAERLSAQLLVERDRAATLPEPARTGTLEHLTQIRHQLSGVNIARGAVRRVVPHDALDTAYDVLEEVYATLEWNLALAPGDPQLRGLPSAYTGSALILDGQRYSLTPGAGEDPARPRGIAR